MERHHRNVGAVNAPLQETPKVLQTIRVNFVFGVLHGVVNKLVNIFTIQSFIRLQSIRE